MVQTALRTEVPGENAGAQARDTHETPVKAAPMPGALDTATILRASRAISSNLVIGELQDKLLELAVENAGARRGLFLRQTPGGELTISAEMVAGQDLRRLNLDLRDAAETLFASIVQYVASTREPVVLANVAADVRFAGDPYAATARACSVLCQPIQHGGALQGILYLEDDRSADAFTVDRVAVIEMLSAQAAISLTNAGLFEEIAREARHRQQAEQALRSIVEGTASATGDDFFRLLVRHLAEALGVRYAFVTERLPDEARVRTLTFWTGTDFIMDFVYDLEPTPCKDVYDGKTVFIPHGLQERFSRATKLVEMAAQSFLAVPLRGQQGRIVGHLAVLDVHPMTDPGPKEAILHIFAARAASELERMRASEGMRRALQEVESLKNRLHAENVYLQEEIEREHDFKEVVGNSPELRQVLAQVGQVAVTDVTVLIYGETGTGKELIARAIHDRSSRHRRPLVKLNCGAISPGLVESELFGHVRGAFTGAIDRRVGRFELAHGSTLFLDEVAELPMETQVKLLRVLQEHEFEPVGSSRTIKVDIRVIVATNRDLKEEVAAGRFRADLYYRLNVFPITVPPLRQRRSDIPLLAMYFLRRFSREMGRGIQAISQGSVDRLVDYAWPGNIRELQNVIERAVVLSQDETLVVREDALPAGPVDAMTPLTGRPPSSPAPLKSVEREHIAAALERAGWVIEGSGGAAELLGLHPNTLRSRLKKMKMSRPAVPPLPSRSGSASR